MRLLSRSNKTRLKLIFYYLISLLGVLSLMVQQLPSRDLSRGEDFAPRNPRHVLLEENADKIIELGEVMNDRWKLRELMKLIRIHLLHPPSVEPYDLKESPPIDVVYTKYKQYFPSWVFINSVLWDLFRNHRSGFFVEAGALDGEYLSNTLQLEKNLSWTGLLIEVETRNYIELLKKHRKAWSSPVCFTSGTQPHKATLSTFSKRGNLKYSGMGAARIQNNITGSYLDSSGYQSFQTALCIPANILLETLNVSYVDFFSLDVEEMEWDILKTFPFDKIIVDVWAVEHVRKLEGVGLESSKNYSTNGQTDQFKNFTQLYLYEDPLFIEFMEEKGYYLFDMYCQTIPDYIFIRKKSKIFKNLEVPPEFWKRKGLCAAKGEWNPKKMSISLESLRDQRHWPSLKFKGS